MGKDGRNAGQPPTKPKSCLGLLYFSQNRYNLQKSPVCTGFAKRLDPTADSSQLLSDSIPGGEFKYACLGYSAWDDEALKHAAQQRNSPTDAVQLPYCEGLEVVSSAAINSRPELLTEMGPGVRRNPPPSVSDDAHMGPRPGRTYTSGAFGQPHLPQDVDFDQFKERFDRISKKIVDKMAQNAAFIGVTLKKSWDQILREVTGRERPPS